MESSCLEPMGWFRTAESPFGVHDVAGWAVESNEGEEPSVGEGPWTVVGGGSWATGARMYFGSASRIAPDADLATQGLRLVARRR